MPLNGLYRGVVRSASDPTGQRRLLVDVPALEGVEQRWALPCVPAASRAMPKVGATVWVTFENDEAQTLVWIGTLPRPA